MKISRRAFLADSLAAAAIGAAGRCSAIDNMTGGVYPGWKPGEMDIHLIHTGTSENTFFIFPDGTTMLLDCGHILQRPAAYSEAIPPMPSGERGAGEWVSRYIQRLIPQREIDYLMISHWHSDHIAGIPDVARSFRFLNYFDHQYPDVGKYRWDVSAQDFNNVQKWADSTTKEGMKREPFKVGAKDQICLQHDSAKSYGGIFEIRNLAANGVMWDGRDGLIDVAAAHLEHVGGKQRIQENSLSSAIRIRYGNFTYYTGGDLRGEFIGPDGKKFDYEARVGEVTGPVTVCKTNHHSYFDSMGNAFIKATRPQLFLSSSWSPNQQNVLTLSRMASQKNYKGPRLVAYGFIPESRMREFEKQGLAGCLAPAGHAVVKVAPGGSSFKLYTLTTRDESMSIVGTRDFTC